MMVLVVYCPLGGEVCAWPFLVHGVVRRRRYKICVCLQVLDMHKSVGEIFEKLMLLADLRPRICS